MEKTVLFRDFEERDIDFIYRCKNDEKMNSLIVGQFKPFSHDDAVKWVHGCMGEHENFKFWAICTNDEDRRIVGWLSLSQIDKYNQSACFHGVFIGDKDYHDGMTLIESYLFLFEYCFETLQLNRVHGSTVIGQKQTSNMGKLFYMEREGILRQAVYKNGEFIDVAITSLLKEEYFEHKMKGDYQIRTLIKRIAYLRKNKQMY